MKEKLDQLISKTQYFTENQIEILDIQSLGEDKYKILTNDRVYELLLLAKDAELDLFNELKHEKLESIGTKAKHTYELGMLRNLGKTYIIRDFKNEISLGEFLKKSDRNSKFTKGSDFGKILRKLHDLDVDNKINWYKFFDTKANYLFYMHGVSDVAADDYILTDYISGYKQLAKNVETSYLYRRLDLDHIFVTDEGDFHLEGLDFNTLGDKVFDFTQINTIAIDNKDFARGVMDGYFNGKRPPIKFFRLLSLYQAYEILDSTVKSRASDEAKLSADEISSLMKMYDNFNLDVPDWT